MIQRYSVIAALAAWMLSGAAQAQQNSAEIMSREPAQLIELLKKADATTFEKAKACQRLAVVGGKDAIPALADLLADETLNLYARFGLEPIPDPAVDEVFRAAAVKLKGRQQIGVINSIGQRKDAKAIELLKGLFADADPAVASAAVGAVGRIGTLEAAAVLRETLGKAAPAKLATADACLACSESLVAAGKTAEAVALLEAVRNAEVPKFVKAAVIGKLIRLGGPGAKDLLIAQLGSDDKMYFNVGLDAARIAGPDATASLIAEYEKLPADRKARLLRVLGERKDRVPAAVLTAAAQSAETAVREAAIVVLARLGDASAADILLETAIGDSPVAQAAKEGLMKIAGKEVDALIVAKLAGASGAAKVAVLDLIGGRSIRSATEAVKPLVADSDLAVRLAAIGALAQLVELKDIDLLLKPAMCDIAAEETKPARAAVAAAVGRLDPEACATRVGGLLQEASPSNQEYLIDLLGTISGKKALALVVACAKSSDEKLKDHGTKALGDWNNADAAPALLEIAQTETDKKFQIRAVRGYIRIGRQLLMSDEDRLAMFQQAMKIAKRPDDKKLALDILTRIPSGKTALVAVESLGEPALRDASADAAVKIATKLTAEDAPAVAQAMEKVVASGIKGVNLNRAKELLEQAKAKK